jgi:hypothetical protein
MCSRRQSTAKSALRNYFVGGQILKHHSLNLRAATLEKPRKSGTVNAISISANAATQH